MKKEKKIDAIINRGKRKLSLNNKGGKIFSHKQIIEELDEITESTVESSFDYLIYYFKGDSWRKRLKYFQNQLTVFRK